MATKITIGEAVLYNSTTGTAFGPLWTDYEDAEDFLKWCRWHRIEESRELDELAPAELAKVLAEWRLDLEERVGKENVETAAAAAEWIKECEAREKDSAAELRRKVAALIQEADALERGDGYMTGVRLNAAEGVAGLQAGETIEDAYGRALSAFARDNGDAIPQDIADKVRAEVDKLFLLSQVGRTS